MGKALLRTDKEIAEIYDRNFRSVWNVTLTLLKNRAETEDCVQDVFLQLIRKAPVFENPEHERGWLILTAKNLAKNRLAHWWRRRADLDEAAEIGVSDPEPDATLAAVLTLPEKDRLVLYLYYYEGYAVKEIALLLGLNPATVRSRLTRAREKLKTLMGGIDG